MKETSVAPYILAHKKKIKERAERVIKERTDRLRSAFFTMNESLGWDNVAVVHMGDPTAEMADGIRYSHLKVDLNKNSNESMNVLLLAASSKVICIALGTIDSDQISSVYTKIESSKHDLIVCHEEYCAMSFELFFLAQGLDELLEKPNDAILDLALRAELLGGTLSSKWVYEAASAVAKKNIEKGRLIVNRGSSNFSQ